MVNLDYFKLLGGIDARLSFDDEKERSSLTFWKDAVNIDIEGATIRRTNGSKNILNSALTDGSYLTHINEYENADKYYLMAISCDNKLYQYNETSGVLEEKHSGFISNNPVSCTHNNEFVVVTGASDPFLYNSTDGSIRQTGFYAANNAYGTCCESFHGRLFIADGAFLYYSALLNPTDWTTANDAGYLSDLQGQITSIKRFGEYLAIRTHDETYLLSGNSPDTFVVTRFADKGVSSPFNCVNFKNQQYFYSEYGFHYLGQFGDLSQIKLSSDLSTKIESLLIDIPEDRLSEVIAIPYEKRNQIWFYVPNNDLSLNYLKKCWILDFSQNSNVAFFERQSTKQIMSGCAFKGSIYTSTSDGKLLKEDEGDTFDGDAIECEWYSPWFSFGSRSRLKSCEYIMHWFDTRVKTNFTLVTKYNGQSYKEKVKTFDLGSKYVTVNEDYINDDTYLTIEDRVKKKVIITKDFTSIQFGIRSNGIGSNFRYYGFSLDPNIRLLSDV